MANAPDALFAYLAPTQRCARVTMRASGLKNPSTQCATNVALQLLRSISFLRNAVKNVVKKAVGKGKARIGDIPPQNDGSTAVFVPPIEL